MLLTEIDCAKLLTLSLLSEAHFVVLLRVLFVVNMFSAIMTTANMN